MILPGSRLRSAYYDRTREDRRRREDERSRAGFKWLAQQPPQPLDRVQEPADEGGHVEQRDHAQRGED